MMNGLLINGVRPGGGSRDRQGVRQGPSSGLRVTRRWTLADKDLKNHRQPAMTERETNGRERRNMK